jgi:ATP-binding cassette subfamily B protein
LKQGVKSILKEFWGHRWKVILGLVCLLVVDAAQLTIPLVVKAVVDAISSSTATLPWMAREAAILFGLALVVALFRFAWRHFFFSAARQVELDLRNRILDHMLELSTRYFTKTRTGEVMALATNDVESVRQAIAMGFVAGFDASIYALVAIGAMLWLDPVLALWTILPLPFLAVLMGVSLRAIYDRWDKVQTSFEGLTEKVRESVTGIRVLRAYVQEDGDVEDFERHSRDYYDKYMNYVKVDAIFHPAILLLAGTCVAILLGVGGARVMEGRTSIGSFVAFTSYLGMLTWPMIAAGWMLSLVQRASASMDRIDALLKNDDVEDDRAAPVGARIEGGFEVRGLDFSYPGQEEPALKGLSFAVPAGGSLGVVGEVASGKSTVAQLLCRMYDPPPGTILLDGLDVLDLPPGFLRARIAYVPQEAFLFSDTVAENLRLGKPDATPEEMEQACRLAALHDEIAQLPKGYETLLGERGITLSGGQKQRLCLARALLKPAPILLLDDTLSAVDAETERDILARLKAEASRRTTVVISHRASAVRDLDRILCLQRGSVVQSGTHEEMVRQEGFYKIIVELQEMEK